MIYLEVNILEKNRIGEYIKTKRKEKGLTQQELGDKLYVTDKAVSKWERNLGLPDITILNELAKVLDTTVNNILNGSDNSDTIIDPIEELTRVKKEITKTYKRRVFYLSSIFIIILTLIIISNISFGYELKKVNFSHFYPKKEINLGIPKTSFMMKYNDKSFSYKNFRNKSILENEVKKYLKTLKYLNCNDTIYYYNDIDNFSITAYSVDNHFFYKTINYTLIDDDYCRTQKLKEYQDKLGGLRKVHSLNTNYQATDTWENKLIIMFIDSIDLYNPYRFGASLSIEYLYMENGKLITKVLESSTGTYEIKDDKLYYYRENISKKDSSISIPEVSTFKLDNSTMILIDDYLDKYSKDKIILK